VDLLFGSYRYDLALRFARTYPAAAVESAASEVGGIARAEAWSGARASLQGDDGTLGNSFAVTAPPPATRLLTPEVEQGRWLRPGDGRALVVNRRVAADDPRFRVGATVSLLIAGRPSSWTVVGVVESGPSAAAYAPRETIAGILGGGGASALMVDAAFPGAASQLDLLQRLREELGNRGFEVQSGGLIAQQRKVVEDHLLMVASFLGMMGTLMIVVGGLGLASTMSLAVLERTREIGVLRALGARHRSILVLVQVEALVIGLASWLLALPLSVPMSVVLGRAFSRIMIRVPVILVPDAGGVVRWLVVVVVVSLLAAAWPAWRATRVSTAAALAYE
jgi:putative ABC transport system permease protein